MKPLLAVVLLTVAAPLGADVVTISCRGADGALAPCTRKLTGGALGYHELSSSARAPRHTGPASYAPVYDTPVWGGGGGWGGSNGGHRGGQGGHRAASSAHGAAPRSQAAPHPAAGGGGRTRGGRY